MTRAGAEVVRGAFVTGIELGAGAMAVRTEGRVWPASVVALATGKHPCAALPARQARWLALLHLERPAGDPGTRRHRAARLLPRRLCRRPPGGGRILSVAWVMQDHLVRTVGSDWSAQRAHLSHQSSLIGLLAGARPLFARPVATAAIPYGFLRAKPVAPTVFPIGDQLAVVPSFTGDGMAIALYSGLEAARAVMAGQPAASYQRALIRRLRPQFRLAGGIGRLLETPATCGTAIAAARLLPLSSPG